MRLLRVLPDLEQRRGGTRGNERFRERQRLRARDAQVNRNLLQILALQRKKPRPGGLGFLYNPTGGEFRYRQFKWREPDPLRNFRRDSFDGGFGVANRTVNFRFFPSCRRWLHGKRTGSAGLLKFVKASRPQFRGFHFSRTGSSAKLRCVSHRGPAPFGNFLKEFLLPRTGSPSIRKCT